MDLTIRKMQKYLKEKYRLTKPLEMNNTQRYFFRLIEEVGELSDVLYYVLVIANTYDIDLEECFRMKKDLNRERYGHKLKIDDV